MKENPSCSIIRQFFSKLPIEIRKSTIFQVVQISEENILIHASVFYSPEAKEDDLWLDGYNTIEIQMFQGQFGAVDFPCTYKGLIDGLLHNQKETGICLIRIENQYGEVRKSY